MKTYTKWEMENVIMDLLSKNVFIETIQTSEGYNPRFYIKQSDDEIWENYRLAVGVDEEFIKMAISDVVKRDAYQIDEFTLAGRTNENYMAYIVSGVVNTFKINELNRLSR